jgi:hypothetical protein
MLDEVADLQLFSIKEKASQSFDGRTTQPAPRSATPETGQADFLFRVEVVLADI